jgi:hypothetical protein
MRFPLIGKRIFCENGERVEGTSWNMSNDNYVNRVVNKASPIDVK